MAMSKSEPNKGVLFRNGYKEDGDKRPDFTGGFNVNGQDYKVAAWVNESKKGAKYMSLSIDEDEGTGEGSEVPF